MNFALGDTNSKRRIYVRPEIDGSSLFEEVGECEVLNVQEVEVRRFDECIHHILRPSLCKVDVQGAELMVLRGMGERIQEIDVMIVETSLIPTLRGDPPDFSDVNTFMEKAGFVLYDIVGMHRRPLDRALAQIDAVYVKRESPLRSDRRWGY